MSSLVSIEIKDHIARVLLNRPEKSNALNPEMFNAIIEASEMLKKDKSVRVIILSGKGKDFCAGLDFECFEEMVRGEGLEQGAVGTLLNQRSRDGLTNYAQLAAYTWKQQTVPVIAALRGVAFGGGFQVALCADIRLASPDARFSLMEAKWGIIPDMSATQTLRDLVRLDVAKELIFTGRIFEAPEAERLGLITRICSNPIMEADKLANEIALKSPDAVAAAKELYETAWHAAPETGLRLEETLQKTLIGSENQIEAVSANFEKRMPVFKERR